MVALPVAIIWSKLAVDPMASHHVLGSEAGCLVKCHVANAPGLCQTAYKAADLLPSRPQFRNDVGRTRR
jgi:hypothetical protein